MNLALGKLSLQGLKLKFNRKIIIIAALAITAGFAGYEYLSLRKPSESIQDSLPFKSAQSAMPQSATGKKETAQPQSVQPQNENMGIKTEFNMVQSPVAKGQSLYNMQATKEEKETELAIKKAQNDIKKEEIKSRFYESFPELALEGKGMPMPKHDLEKKPVPVEVKPAPQPAPSQGEGIDQIRLMAVVGDITIWDNGKGTRNTTKIGGSIAGHILTRILSDGIELERDGKRIIVAIQ